jgi:Protein of unknown function (DUF1674)
MTGISRTITLKMSAFMHVFKPSLRTPSRRLLSSSTSTYSAKKPWQVGPSPQPLPKEEQEIFEQLQKASTGAFSTPSRSPPKINQSPDSTSSDTAQASAKIEARSAQEPDLKLDARVEATGDGEELHPDIRRGAQDEFEGEVNPKTGEVGGPKREPQRWGTGEGKDWSYNGRVTDF